MRCAEVMSKPFEEMKIITCHLGNGSSIAAIKHGKVIDTSMGLTPLDGFMMGTRSGGVDPSAVLYLMKKEGWNPDQASDILNKKSGALGISGVSSDERDIKAAAREGNQRAQLSQVMMRYQVRKFIGAYAAAMNGVDAIVFTGGIGENNKTTRLEICESLGYLGVKADKAVNDNTRAIESRITTDDSAVQVWVIPTNEELLIARETAQLAK
jgi:acetate kinase